MTVHTTLRREYVGHMSGEEAAAEHRAKRIVVDAYAAFRSAIQDALSLTELRKGDLQALLDAMTDAVPCPLAWGEAISEARRAD